MQLSALPEIDSSFFEREALITIACSQKIQEETGRFSLFWVNMKQRNG